MPKALDKEEVRKTISNFPYKIVAGEAINTLSELIFKCPTHGDFSSNLKAIRNGFGCRRCSAKKRGNAQKLSLHNFSIKLQSKHSGVVLVGPYLDQTTPVKFKCLEHGFFENTPKKVLASKHGCAKCGRSSQGKKLTPISEIQKIVEKKGFVLISNSYDHAKQELELCCHIHGKFFRKLNAIKRNQMCKRCSYKNAGNAKRISSDKACEIAKKQGYGLGSNYVACSKKSDFICDLHGIFSSRLNDIKNGHGCPKCSIRLSKPADDIFIFLQSLNINLTKNDRTVLVSPISGRNLELDIYIPSKQVAIEYCGLYWHNENSPEPRNRNYHKTKHDLCAQKGIQLITIFEDEWLESQDKIKNILKAKLGLLPKIYARKTKLINLDKQVAIKFLNEYHLQGACSFILALGLEYEGKIVGCATLSKHHRQGRSEAVLSRVCFSEYAVVGGTSKLLKPLILEAQKLGFSHLISWSDNRWSNGGVYRELKMIPEKLGPDYSYTKDGSQKRASKQSCQKKHLLKKGAVGNTELEMAKSLGYSRIWDCGKIRWSLDLSE